MNYIYAIKNLCNDKVYVGQTTKTVKHRWNQHKARFFRKERDHKLYKAMAKYGVENFYVEVLACVPSTAYLKYIEEVIIRDYDSFLHGYNMTCGDNTIDDATRVKISKKLKGRKINWIDKIMSTKTIRGTYKVGATNTSSKRYLIQGPEGIEEVKGLSNWCKTLNICPSNLIKTLGTKKIVGGFTLLARFND